MDNPYWYTQGSGHFIDLESIKLSCFELLNIFEANRALYESFEHLRAEARALEDAKLTIEDAVLLDLHEEYASKRISQLLLNIAITVRTYDDIMQFSEDAEKYKQHSDSTSGHDYIGVHSVDEKFDLRGACNTIIHAREVRPLYERLIQLFWSQSKRNCLRPKRRKTSIRFGILPARLS